jgi:hypothetical protein
MPSNARSLVLPLLGAASIGIGLAPFAIGLAGCNQLPPERGTHVQTVASDKLEKRNAIEVAVPPIQNATGDDTVPIVDLREAFQAGLVRRRYSPLSLDYVDRKVIDATYTPGSLQESAVLQVEIQGWDTSLFETRAALTVKARARLIDAENPANGQLWSGTLDHRFDFEAERDRFTTQESFLRYACGRVADELLAALPAREAHPGS